ncbi:pyruvate kinase [Testudinibacter sp. P27/CKL/0425]
MFPSDNIAYSEKVPHILEHQKFIGLGDWEEKAEQIPDFCEKIQVNDIIAVKNGAKLIALVQVIGGVYYVNDDETDSGWMVYHRPIRVLDWALNDEHLPHARGTLNRCVNDVETTQIIKNWYARVKHSFKERGLSVVV